MTTVRFFRTKPTPEGESLPVGGTLRFTPTRKRVVEHVEGPAETILPIGFTAQVPSDTGRLDVDLAPTEPGWVWEIYSYGFGVTSTFEYVIVPDQTEPIDEDKLVRVSKDTLDPEREPDPAWWAELESAKALGSQVQQAKTHAVVAASDAGAARDQAQSAQAAAQQAAETIGGSVSGAQQAAQDAAQAKDGAVTAANTATQAADEATQAADNATSVAGIAGNLSDRLTGLEAVAGLTTEAPIDGQTANLIQQPNTLTKTALNAAYIGADSDPLQPLDLWPAFNADGGSGSWPARTYDTYILGVKSALAEPISQQKIKETDRGVGSNGVDHIWSYRAGHGPMKALIVSGLHADELLCHFVGLRWFQAFATSDHPAMVALRGRLTVEWVACANPSGYNSVKENANGVNLNRNFKFYENVSVAPNKGAAPFSEIESQIVKSIVDEGNMCVIDLHSRGPVGTNDIGWSAGSPWIAADRTVPMGALDTWRRTYADVAGGPATELLVPTEPTLNNWALWYGRWDGTRQGNTAMLLETSTDHFGSSATVLSARAAKAMCGFITTYLGMWLNKGITPSPSYPILTRATGPSATNGTSWITGGNRLDASTWTPLTWGAISPTSGGKAGQEIFFVAPYPCDIKITVEGFATYSAAAGGTPFRGTLGISLDDASGPHPSSTTTFSIESTDANRRQPFQATFRFEDNAPDGSTVHAVRVWFQRNSGGTADLSVVRAFVELVPRWESYPHPTVRQGEN